MGVAVAGAAETPLTCTADLDEFVRLVLDLQRRVVDTETSLQHLLEPATDRMAVVALMHEYMRRKRREAAPDLPHMQIVE